MKKKLLFFLTFFIFLNSNGQIASFKINPKSSTISTDIVSTETIKVNGIDENVYKSAEIIEFNYQEKDKNIKIQILTKLKNDLYNDSRTEQPNAYNSLIIKSKTDSIKLISNQITKIEKKQDSLYFEYTKDLMTIKKANILNFGSLRSRAFFDIVYGNTSKTFRALGNTGLNLGNKSASLYSEIVSANLGIMRVSLGATVAKSTSGDSLTIKNDEAYQRLVNNGGNTVLNLEYPLVYLHSKNNLYNFITTINTKGTADIPAFGTNTTNWAGSGSFGFNLYGEASTSKNEISFFANLNLNMYYGTNTFRDNLGIEKNSFTFGQLSAGIIFLNNFKISFIIATLSSESSLRNKHVIAGGQVLR